MSKPALLEMIENQWPDSHYEVTISCDEFTCLCPYTGKTDFATLTITYTPTNKLIEIVSLKQYLASFSNVKILQEFAINQICQDLGQVLHPKILIVKGEFSARGGVKITPTCSYKE